MNGVSALERLRPWAAWVLAGWVMVAAVTSVVLAGTAGDPGGDPLYLVWALVPVLFATSGVLIVSSQPGNVIGWLLLVPALAMAVISPLEVYLNSLAEAPAFSVWMLLVAAVVGLSWVWIIFPLFHLLQVFPTGRVLSPRWRWLTWLELVMLAVLFFIVVFSETVGPLEGSWTMTNPFGFIPQSFVDGPLMTVWTPGLGVLAVGGLASTVVRFRRASRLERRQISLVLYTVAAFALIFAGLLTVEGDQFPVLADLVFVSSIVAIPIVIAYAVIRRGLFDINVIIRRTLSYAILTGLLAAVYAGSVFVFRSLLGRVLGADSSLSVAASTLLVAGLFSPARTRISRLIDRRLFRGRYDPQQVVEDFARSVRDVTDLGALSRGVFGVVGHTLQPRRAGIWISGSG